jgi:DNA replication protein DnaC
MKASGLANQISRCRMDNFKADDAWQREVKERAARYIADESPAWWFIGGAVGAGKTHISTAICRALLGRGLSVSYMLWTDEITRLKAVRYDAPEEYRETMDRLKGADVLYIDDLYKRIADRDRITDADVLILYDIINHRYMKRARTLISSERYLSEIMEADEGIGSRIAEMAKGYVVTIGRGEGKNWRVREAGE